MNLLLDGLSRRWSTLWETLDKTETTFMQSVSELSLDHGKHWLRKETDDRLRLDAVVLFEEDRSNL